MAESNAEKGVSLKTTTIQLECSGAEGVRIYGECKKGEDSKLTRILSKLGIAEILNTLVEFEDLSKREVLPYGLKKRVWYIPVRLGLDYSGSVED